MVRTNAIALLAATALAGCNWDLPPIPCATDADCPASLACLNQFCGIPQCNDPSMQACGSLCTRLSTDVNNCGACGHVCPSSAPDCNSGVCAGNEQPFVISATVSGSGTGSITSAPAGINCPSSACSATFQSNSQVILTANADSGSTFTGWSGACSGTGSCAVTMSNGTVNVSANFDSVQPQDVRLTIGITGSGTVTSNVGALACSSACSGSFAAGSTVTLSASPMSTSEVFLGWGGACSGVGNCVLTLNADTSVTAAFGAVSTESISVTVSGTGTVVSSPAGINCASSNLGTCSYSFNNSSTVTLTATGSGGESFASWSGCTSSSGDSCSVALAGANVSLGATFAAASTNVDFTIDAEVSPSVPAQYEAVVSLMPGESTAIPISLALASGATGPVALTVTGLPAGVTAQFAPASVTPPGTSTLTLAVAAGTPVTASMATLSVTGTAGTDTQTAYVYFDVRSPVLVGPVALAIEPGGATALVVDGERLVRVDTVTRLATKTIASAFLQPRRLELEEGAETVLLVEQGTGSLLRVVLSTGAVTVLASGLESPYGLAIEEGGSTALVSYTGTGSNCSTTGGVVRANLSTGAITSMATGIRFPRSIAIEAGGSSALVAEAGTTYYGGCGTTNANIDRIDLANHSVTILGGSSDFYPDAIVLESGGATALVTHNGSLLRFGVATGTFTPLLVEQQEQAAYPTGIYDLAIEASGTTALVVDGDLNLLRRASIQGQLTPIAPASDSPAAFIATSGSHGVTMETATTLLVTDCATVNCAATATPSDRLLRVHTDTGEVEVVANTLAGPAGIALEDGGTTALVVQNQYTGTANVVRVTLSGSGAGTVSSPLVTGFFYPQAIAIEPGGTSVLLSNGNIGISRGDLVHNTLVTVAQGTGSVSAIAIPGGTSTSAYFTPDYADGALYEIDRTKTNQTPTLVANLLAGTEAMQLEASGATAIVGLTGGEIDRVNVSTGATTVVSSLSQTAQGLAMEPAGSVLALGAGGDGISAAVTRVGLGNPNIPSVLPGSFELPGAIAIESNGTTALMLDCDPTDGYNTCSSLGRLVRIDLGTGALTILKTGYNFTAPSPLAIAPDGNSVLIADCGPAGSTASCNGNSRLLSVPLDGNVTNPGTVILSNMGSVGGISFEASNQALISVAGTGNILRAFITTKGSITLATGLQLPGTIAVEAGDTTALIATTNNLVRMDLADGGTTNIASLDQSTFAVEPGGATAVLVSFTNLYRANLTTGAIDTLNATPGYLPQYSEDGYGGLLGLAFTPDGGTLMITESSGYSANGRVLALPVPQ